MLFNEGRFFIFLALVWSVHWMLRSDRPRKLWLLAASYVFYGAWDWRFLSLIAGSTVIDYYVGRKLSSVEEPARRRPWLIVSLAANLGLLGVFKYYNFFADSARSALFDMGLPVSELTLDIVLPVGISFYTFQTLSYTIDVYRRRLEPVASFSDFALFVAFFPQLVAGPIVRAADFLPQLRLPRRFCDIAWRSCATLFLLGFIKKACVADNFAVPVDLVFGAPESYAAIDLWLGAALYTIQIYCDFSGYSDMAIATAGLLGYQLPLNFDFPYLASSITQFWRRWHISLSSWFRDYLYIPLGGNRVGPTRTYVNLLMVFFLCGLWHGANWTFVVWGLYHGGLLMLERVGLGKLLARLPRLLSVPWVLALALIGWVPFRAADLETGGYYLARMFGAEGRPLIDVRDVAPPGFDQGLPQGPLWNGWWAVVIGFAVVHRLMYTDRLVGWVRNLPAWAFAVLYGVAIALVLPWMAVGYTPFIYFQF